MLSHFLTWKKMLWARVTPAVLLVSAALTHSSALAEGVRSKAKGGTQAEKKANLAPAPVDPQGATSIGGLMGIGLGLGATLGADVYLRPVRHFYLGGTVLAGSANMASSMGEDANNTFICTKADATAIMALGSMRFYIGDKFFLNTGIGWRRYQVNIAFEQISTSTNSFSANVTADAVVVELGLGTIWHFRGGLYLGGEWLGAALPVSSSYSETTGTTGALTSGQSDMDLITRQFGAKISKLVTYHSLFLIGKSF